MNEIELYIHIPFCVKKCDYCDFFSYAADESEQNRYVDSLLREIRLKSVLLSGDPVVSVFIGGGTPSCISGGSIKKILDQTRRYYNISKNCEITIEVNPGTLSEEKLDIYLQSGINRVSVGAQSVNDKVLRLLGRIHNFETFMSSFDLIVKSGFKNINVDMIYGAPGQNPKEYKEELEIVSKLKISHLSAYCLILEKGTPLYKKRELLDFPDDDSCARMFEITSEILKKHNLNRYEISNYALKGFESVHNTGYWQDVPYLGFGLSCSSYLNNTRWKNISDLEKYEDFFLKHENSLEIKEIQDFNEITDDFRVLTLPDQYNEFVFLGLRMTKGISRELFYKKFKKDIFNVFADKLDKHIFAGTLIKNSDRIYIPEKYLFVSNSILSDIII